MATTDSRTGFRLPWSTDRVASREASADPVDELVAVAPTVDGDDTTRTTPGPGDTSDQDAAGNGVRGQEEALVTILAPDAAQAPAEPVSTTPAAAAHDATTGVDGATPAPAAVPGTAAPMRRPTKFLADLTRAMQAAAEQARTATLDQYRAESTTVIEQIHARSATGATELRRHADDDAATIKEWSKAEIARIREETEQRITTRREQLEGQLERHAAIIEHEIEKVRGRVATFESEMGVFFDDLLGEEDPAVFAARAASLPEPPSFEILDDDAITALLQEPGVGVPAPVLEAEAEVEAEAVASPADAEADVPSEAVASEGEAQAAGDAGAEAVAAVETDVDAEAEAEPADVTPLDREAAMAAIQAAAEAAASLEAAVAQADRAEVAADRAEATLVAEPTPDAEATNETSAAEGLAEDVTSETGEAASTAAPAADEPLDAEPEIDPRLAMLGLTPDFAAAEMAAAEAAAAEIEDVPEIAGDALEARLAGLVPGEAPAPAVATVTTQLVVTGLVSVASIASFKRHVGRLPGVAHVGVSSGPDGEFLFSVEHDPETSVRDLVPTLPGFGARVVGTGEGIVHVSAQDPQD
jgi:hypothetical protein